HARPRTCAADPEGRDHRAVAEHGVAGFALAKPERSPETEAAPRRALAAGVHAQLAPLHQERHAGLQRLRGLDRPHVAEIDVAPGAGAVILPVGAVAARGRLVVDVVALPSLVPAADGVRERRPAEIAGYQVRQ